MKQQSISKQSVQHGRSRTRNQRKRELVKNVFMGIALVLLWFVLCTIMVKAWLGHPAEQPVSYEEHVVFVQTIGGDSNA